MSICTSRSRAAIMVAFACAYAACERTPVTGPIETLGADTEFFAPTTFSEMQNNAQSEGTLRVDIDVIDGSLVASEVTIQFTGGDEPEVIDSRVKDISVDGSSGSIVMTLGDLIVGFNADTKFSDREGNEISLDEFLELVRTSTSVAGPPIRASRPAPETLQAPDDDTFVASHIRLGPGDEDESSLEVNIGLVNLLLNGAPPPDAWIHVLNLMIELRVSEGITEIEIETPEFDKVEFEGVVASVNLDRRSFTLRNGTVVRLIDATKIRFEDGQEHHLPSLEAVARAIENGRTVVSHGVGVVEEDQDRRVIVAIRVAFLVRPPPMERFHGQVLDVDLTNSAFILPEGVVVRIDANTKIRQPDNISDVHHLGSLEAVARALADNKIVKAAGHGIVESETDEGVRILAVVVVFEVELPPLVGFEGEVAEVHVDRMALLLMDGTVIQLTEDTKILATATDHWSLNGLAAVAEALRQGAKVIVHGRGFVTSEEPNLVIEAVVIAFHIEPPDLTEFEGIVASVNLDRSSLTLKSGLEIIIDDETRFRLRQHHFAQVDIPILEILRRVLEAGITVGVSGAGMPEGEAIRAVFIVFHFDFVGEIRFEGPVVDADVEAQTFKLQNGLTIHIVDNITIDVTGDLKSIAEVREALDREVAVHAAGRAVLVVEGELVKAVAAYVKFET